MADLNEGRLDLQRSRARFIAFALVAALIFSVLGARLFHLQVVRGDEYAAEAARSRTVEVPVRAPRGLIFDRAGRQLAVNVPSWTIKIRPADLPPGQTGTILRRIAELTGAEIRTLRGRLDAFKGSPYDLVPVERGVSRQAALIIGEE